MKKPSLFITLCLGLTLITLLVGPLQARAEGLPALQGVDVVQVVVDRIDDDIVAEGLQPLELRTDIEIKLRQYGIRVVKSVLQLPLEKRRFIELHMTSIKPKGRDFYIYALELYMFQFVYLPREKMVLTTAVVWSRNVVGLVSENQISGIRQGLAGLLDLFINDYLEANPR